MSSFHIFYFVDDHGDVAMESASVGKGIEESFKEKMFFFAFALFQQDAFYALF